MVLPLIPLGIVGAGAALGAGYSIFKKQPAPSQTEYHAPYETYAPQKSLQYAPVNTITYPDYHIQIESPGARMTTKKTIDVESKPTFTPTQEVSGATGPSSEQGLDLVPIVVVGGIAFIAVQYLKRR